MNTRERSDADASVKYGQPTAEQILHMVWTAGVAQCRAWGLNWAGVAEMYSATGELVKGESAAATAAWFGTVAQVAEQAGYRELAERSSAKR